MEVKAYVENICELGRVVNTSIVLGVAEGIRVSKDRMLFGALPRPLLSWRIFP